MAAVSDVSSDKNGAGLDLSDKAVWDKYKPTCDFSWANYYYVSIAMKMPNVSATDFHKFKYTGYDLVIGWGEPAYGKSSQFLDIKGNTSFVIDGFHNGICKCLDDSDAPKPGGSKNISIDIWWKHDGEKIKSETNKDMTVDYNGKKTLTWGLVKKILADGGKMYVRGWIRVRALSENEPHTVSGYLYCGYDNFHESGKYGHTFNNGLFIKQPRPAIEYLNHRTNDYQDGSNHRKYPAKFRISYDPYMTIMRGPSSGTFAETGGACHTIASHKYGYLVKFQIYMKGDWSGAREYKVYEEIIDDSKIERTSDNHPWTKDIVINTGDFGNDAHNHPGCRVFARIQTYQRKSTWSEGEWHGPADYGYASFGWDTSRKASSNSYKTDHRFSIQSDFRNNNYPHHKTSITVSQAPRVNNILKPGTRITVRSDITDADGDRMTRSLKFRSRQAEENNGYYNKADIVAISNDTNTGALSVTKTTDELLAYFDSVLPKPTDRRAFGYEFCAFDQFTDIWTMKSDYYYSDYPGWTQYVLEYPLKDLKVKVTNAANRTTVSGQSCLVMRNITAQIQYNHPRGDNGMHHSLEVSKHVPGAADRSKEKVFILGSWHEEWDFNERLKLPSTRSASIDLYSHFGNSGRGCFYKFYTGVTSPGGWSYEKQWNSGNDTSDVVFLNAFPRCTLNTLSYTHTNDGKTSVNVNYSATDSFFNLKTFRLDLTVPSTGKVITLKNTNVSSHGVKTLSATESYNVTDILKAHSVDPNSLIGSEIQFHAHAENIYPFSQTWDGTRSATGEFCKSMTYDRNPLTVLSVNTTKGESVTIHVSKDSTYTKRVRGKIYVKESTEDDSHLKMIADFTTIPFSINWNPSSKYSASYRGKKFEFKYDITTDYGINIPHIKNDNRFFTWNEPPSMTLTSNSINYDNYGGYLTRPFSTWGKTVSISVKTIDPETKTIYYTIRQDNVDTTFSKNVAAGTVNDTMNITAADFNAAYKSQHGRDFYPLNLDKHGILDTFNSLIKAKDSFGVYSNQVVSSPYLLLDNVTRDSYACSAGAGSTSSNGVVIGNHVNLSFDLSMPLTSQFTSTSYKFRHYVEAREINSNYVWWVGAEQWHAGNDVKSKISFSIDGVSKLGTSGGSYSNGKFEAGKHYEFRIGTTVQKQGNDSTKIYSINSGWFGNYMVGTNPNPLTLTYPTSVQQPMRNPPLILHIPNQSNPSNATISDIGIIVNGNWIGWNNDNNWIANKQTNYNNKTVVFNWVNNNGRGVITRVKFRLKSGITGMTADSQEYLINVNNTNYVVSSGELVRSLDATKSGINALRQAYGMSNYSFPSAANGTFITLDNHIHCLNTAFNEWVTKVKTYGTPASNLSIPNNTFILANITQTTHNYLTEFKK